MKEGANDFISGSQFIFIVTTKCYHNTDEMYDKVRMYTEKQKQVNNS